MKTIFFILSSFLSLGVFAAPTAPSNLAVWMTCDSQGDALEGMSISVSDMASLQGVLLKINTADGSSEYSGTISSGAFGAASSQGLTIVGRSKQSQDIQGAITDAALLVINSFTPGKVVTAVLSLKSAVYPLTCHLAE